MKLKFIKILQLGIAVVNDVIEDGPTFSQNVFVVNVSESYAGGSPILSLRAVEQDNLLYSIYNARNPSSMNIFKIDATSGDISIKKPLDRFCFHLIIILYLTMIPILNTHSFKTEYFQRNKVKLFFRETIEEHYLTVQVRHQTLKSRSSFARVLVRVYDHNDHAPEFNTKLIQGKVFETAAIGTSIIRVQASDRDKGENAIIIYSISSGKFLH